jgi:hypothetical protein
MGQARLALATAQMELGDLASARRLNRRALGMARANRQRLDEARALMLQGRLASDVEDAQVHWCHAKEIFQAVGSPEAEAVAALMRAGPA